MTSYHGGKKRIGAEIAQMIKQVSSQFEEQTGIQFKGYLEPFCGMLGVYQHIPELFTDHGSVFKYRAGDINESVIKMWKALQDGWKPPTKCSERKFYQLKGNGQSSAEKGFIGHACGYRGVYFSTYDYRISGERLKYNRKNLERISNILTEHKVHIKHMSYPYWSKLKGYVIYCDPPYFKGSNYRDEYNTYQTFEYEHFYKWVEKMAKDNLVFVSERATLPYTIIGQFINNEKVYLINKKRINHFAVFVK